MYLEQNPKPQLNLVINNVEIKQVEMTTLLGITLDCKLSWSKHIDAVVAKMGRSLSVLNLHAYPTRNATRGLHSPKIHNRRTVLHRAMTTWNSIPHQLTLGNSVDCEATLT